MNLDPREWPPWAWALMTLVATTLGYELSLGRYSLGTGIALLAGALLGSRAGAYTQALAALPAIAITGTGVVGSPTEWGYLVGRIAAAYLAGYFVPAHEPLRHARIAWRSVALMLAAAVPAALWWQEPWAGLRLRTYYNAVLVMALVIAFYYALRLVKYPLRVVGLTAALAPYYLSGLAWIAIQNLAGGAGGGGLPWSNVIFHGYVSHLPADVLTCVVVAFFSGARTTR